MRFLPNKIDQYFYELSTEDKFAALIKILSHHKPMSLCASEKKPTKQLFEDLGNLLGEARTIWNPRSSGEEIIKLIKGLTKKIDSMLSAIE